jgi:hypothetical protein
VWLIAFFTRLPGPPVACKSNACGRAFRGNLPGRPRKGANAMDEVIKRYNGRTTSQGHKLDVTQDGDEATIAFQHQGEYGDEYDPYVRVACVQEIEGGFRVRSYYLDAEEPTAFNDYPNEQELFVALDQAVEERSQEVGPLEPSER